MIESLPKLKSEIQGPGTLFMIITLMSAIKSRVILYTLAPGACWVTPKIGE